MGVLTTLAPKVSSRDLRSYRRDAAQARCYLSDHGMGIGRFGNPAPLLRLLHRTFAGAPGPNRYSTLRILPSTLAGSSTKWYLTRLIEVV